METASRLLHALFPTCSSVLVLTGPAGQLFLQNVGVNRKPQRAIAINPEIRSTAKLLYERLVVVWDRMRGKKTRVWHN